MTITAQELREIAARTQDESAALTLESAAESLEACQSQLQKQLDAAQRSLKERLLDDPPGYINPVIIYHLLAQWEGRARDALPADAELINRQARELLEASLLPPPDGATPIPRPRAKRKADKPAQRLPPVPLTDREIEALCAQVGFISCSERDGGEYQAMWTELVRRVEQAHDIHPKP